MKHVNGHILIVKLRQGSELLFGPKVGGLGSDLTLSENFECNGLVPFPSLRQAIRAWEEFCTTRLRPGSDNESCMIGAIRLHIAESDEEFKRFRRSRSLIAIRNHGFMQTLRGAWVPGCNTSAIPGADLCVNGYTPIRSFAAALHIASEMFRQSGNLPTTLAAFSLRRLPRSRRIQPAE